jgi:hypothetical protein
MDEKLQSPSLGEPDVVTARDYGATFVQLISMIGC